jgi:isocitrate dehydrogenase kinase/phosphatase
LFILAVTFLAGLNNVPSNFFFQLRGPATVLSREFLHDLTTARHFKEFFRNMHNKIYNANWKKKNTAARQQFSVRESISVTAQPPSRAA